MPDGKLIESAYTRALLEARRAGFVIGTQAQRRLDAALSQAATNIDIAFRAGKGAPGAEYMKAQASHVMARLDRILSTDVTAAQNLTVSTLVNIHQSVAVDLAKRFGTDAGLMAARFNDVQVRALGVLASRGSNAANFSSLMKYHLDDGIRDVDRLIDAGVAAGVSPAKMAKELGDLLTKRAQQAASWAPTINTVGLDTIRYDARRIAVTEINNALREANRQNLLAAGIVRAAKWQLSGAHAGLPSSPDRCDEMANAPGVDGKPGYYTIADWPLAPHPHCGCTQGGPVLYHPSSQWNVNRKPTTTPPPTTTITPPKPPRVRKPRTPKVKPPVTPPVTPPPVQPPVATPPAPPTQPVPQFTSRKLPDRHMHPLSKATPAGLPEGPEFTKAREGTFATFDEAKAHLEKVGGFDNVSSVARDNAFQGKMLPPDEALRHVNIFAQEHQRLRDNFPGMPNYYSQLVVTDAPRGLSNLGHGSMRVGARAQAHLDNQAVWERINKRRYSAHNGAPGTVQTSEDYVRRVFRHEYGHGLSTGKVIDGWNNMVRDLIDDGEIADTWTKPGTRVTAKGSQPRKFVQVRKKWFAETISDYAADNDAVRNPGPRGGAERARAFEEIAETFAIFTDPGYVPGTLPGKMEQFILDHMLKAGSSTPSRWI